MANQDWNQLGNAIKNMVQSSIDSGDFSELNQGVSQSNIRTEVSRLDGILGINPQGDCWEIQNNGHLQYTEDINYLAQKSSEELNMILAGMTALMNDIDNKVSAMESQNWFRRMVKTVTGKNKLTLAEIQKNRDKLNFYMAKAITELYNRNCIDQKVITSLGMQMNELYIDHIQLKQIVSKLNEKIDSVDNFNMLITEIDHGVYSSEVPIIAICKVMSQFDKRILDNERKLDIIRRSLSDQCILNNNQIELTQLLINVLQMSMKDIGQVYLELGTIRENLMAKIILKTMENYHFLSDLERKIKNKKILIEEIIQAEMLDTSALLSMNEIYEAFLNSKINVKNGLIAPDW